MNIWEAMRKAQHEDSVLEYDLTAIVVVKKDDFELEEEGLEDD